MHAWTHTLPLIHSFIYPHFIIHFFCHLFVFLCVRRRKKNQSSTLGTITRTKHMLSSFLQWCKFESNFQNLSFSLYTPHVTFWNSFVKIVVNLFLLSLFIGTTYTYKHHWKMGLWVTLYQTTWIIIIESSSNTSRRLKAKRSKATDLHSKKCLKVCCFPKPKTLMTLSTVLFLISMSSLIIKCFIYHQVLRMLPFFTHFFTE